MEASKIDMNLTDGGTDFHNSQLASMQDARFGTDWSQGHHIMREVMDTENSFCEDAGEQLP